MVNIPPIGDFGSRFAAVLAVLKCRQRLRDDEENRQEKERGMGQHWGYGSREGIVFIWFLYDNHHKIILKSAIFWGVKHVDPCIRHSNIDQLVAFGSLTWPSGYSEDAKHRPVPR